MCANDLLINLIVQNILQKIDFKEPIKLILQEDNLCAT